MGGTGEVREPPDGEMWNVEIHRNRKAHGIQGVFPTYLFKGVDLPPRKTPPPPTPFLKNPILPDSSSIHPSIHPEEYSLLELSFFFFFFSNPSLPPPKQADTRVSYIHTLLLPREACHIPCPSGQKTLELGWEFWGGDPFSF